LVAGGLLVGVVAAVVITIGCSNLTEEEVRLFLRIFAAIFSMPASSGSSGGADAAALNQSVDIGLSMERLSTATVVELTWTPPEGASGFQFGGLQPTNPDGPLPFLFSEVPAHDEAPDTPDLQLSYQPPAVAGGHVFIDTVVAATADGTVEGFSLSHALGAQSSSALGAGALMTARDVAGSPTWRFRKWLYDPAGAEPLPLTEAVDLIDYFQGGSFFVGLRFPVDQEAEILAYRLPVAFQDGVEPVLAILDHSLPWGDDDLSQSVAVIPLEYLPARNEWLQNTMSAQPATRWAALVPTSETVTVAEDRFPIASGDWELFTTGVVDLRDINGGCLGCQVELYMCHEGDEPPPLFFGVARASAMVSQTQSDGVTCFGPWPQRLVDEIGGVDPELDPPLLLGGAGVNQIDPPAQAKFHHTVEVSGAQAVELATESERGFGWGLYRGTWDQPNLSQPVTGSLTVQGQAHVWLVADIPANAADGIERVRLSAGLASDPSNRVTVADVLWVGDWVAPTAEEPSYWIPVASHADGAQGSVWRTDLGLLNTGTAAVVATITLHAADGPVSMVQAVPPGAQVILRDVVGQLAYSGSGALQVTATADLVVTSRTFSQVGADAECFPDGTLGQSLDGSTLGDGLAAGQVALIPQLQENAAYRTNLAVINISQASATARVHLLDGNGTELASYDVELAPGEWRQENRPFTKHAGQDDMAAGWARVEVLSGAGVIAYGSVVDNTTNDPTTMAMVPASVPAATVWIPVAVHGSGAEGSEWRTDLGLLNTGADAVEATIMLHDGSRGVDMTRTVAAGAQLILTDVVAQLGVSTAAALQVTAAAPLIVTSRTYSQVADDATCFPAGTLGQSLAGTAGGAGLSAGQSAVVPQLQENASYRTNVAVINTGGSPASVTVSLMNGAGVELARYDVDLAAGEWRQDNRPFFERADQTDLQAGWARVEVVTGAGVVAYGSVVSNITNDPTTMAMVTGAQ
jgi:hypothetical protein